MNVGGEGGNHTQKTKHNSVSFHFRKHNMFNGIGSMHCNTTVILTIKTLKLLVSHVMYTLWTFSHP